MVKVTKIIKREGTVVDFDASKIAKAIYEATEAVGEPNMDLAKNLSQKVLVTLESSLKENEIPTVEMVQDLVEKVLIEEGLARIAKSYILYRQKRAEIREEKKQILNKKEIDEVDKRFDVNALRVLTSRYLRKDESGKIIESPKEMFRRVAIYVALSSLLHDKKVFQKKGGKIFPLGKLDEEKLAGKLKIGKYYLNRHHWRGLKRVYEELNRHGKMKVSLSEVISMIKRGDFNSYEEEIDTFYNVMVERKFLPNTPALANFGRKLAMGLACFVLGVDDSLESIMNTLKDAALIFQAGGGVGYNFSHLRPEGDYISTTGGKSSGPISFMTLFDKMTDVIKQGGIRRGASMGILNSSHPDIEKFIVAKKGNAQLRNFNISVFIEKDFWDYYKKNQPYPLVNPRSGKIVRYVNPRNLFDLLVYQGWESAEPGVIFDDNVNRYNPFFESMGRLESCNPCGESLLYPNESCDLGSVNVWAFAKEGKVNWDELAKTVRTAVRFLDNILDVNKYPLERIKKASFATRKVGLGVMGLGDLLYELRIPYNSREGFLFIEKLMEFINYHSKLESIELAKKRGRFPLFNKSFYSKGKLPFRGFYEKSSWHFDWKELSEQIKKYGLRNAYTTIIAPTGSISMIGGTSSGIEPVFSLVYEKKVPIGTFYYVDPVFEKTMSRKGLFDDNFIKDVAALEGSCQKLAYIPPKLKKVFVTSLDIKGEDHVRALAAVQKWVDSSVSKTINFPATATVEEMKKAYFLAHELGCKDMTVFRYKSIQGVYSFGKSKKEEESRKGKKEKGKDSLTSFKDVKAKGPVVYKQVGVNESKGFIGQDFQKENPDPPGNKLTDLSICPICGTPLINSEGCKKCPNCGWSVCSG